MGFSSTPLNMAVATQKSMNTCHLADRRYPGATLSDHSRLDWTDQVSPYKVYLIGSSPILYEQGYPWGLQDYASSWKQFSSYPKAITPDLRDRRRKGLLTSTNPPAQ